LALLVSAALAAPASAAIIYTDLGTAAPPAALGGNPMTPFLPDGRPFFDPVGDVPSPLGGDVLFSYALEHRAVGFGWATWSHGYAGDVYWTSGSSADLTLTLPPGTVAFYFYLEPNPFAEFFFEAIGDGESSGPVGINGFEGARGFGFHNDAGTIAAILIKSLDEVDYAIGEFGIAGGDEHVPEPASMLMLGTGLAGLAAIRRRRQGRS
jgi:hypothetical protein